MIGEIGIAACVLVISYRIANRLPRRDHEPRALRLALAALEPWSFVAAVHGGEVTIAGECSRCGCPGGVSAPPECGGGSACRDRWLLRRE